jgi:hypothetical protein
MNKSYLNAILITIVSSSFIFAFLLAINYLPSTQEFICGGTYFSEKPYLLSSDTGTRGGIQLYFKLDSGETVEFRKTPFTKAVAVGDRVKISYHQGKVFKNKIFDSYEPLKMPSRFWTESELVGIR